MLVEEAVSVVLCPAHMVLELALTVPWEFTCTLNVQFCPPISIEKDAKPTLDGVPLSVNVKLPAPLESRPAFKVAVSPVTPVEFSICAA